MNKTGLTIGCLGTLLLLTNCTTLDSNGFVLKPTKTTYVSTDAAMNEEEPVTAYTAPNPHTRYVNPIDPNLKGTARQDDPDAQKTWEMDIESLPTDYSNVW